MGLCAIGTQMDDLSAGLQQQVAQRELSVGVVGSEFHHALEVRQGIVDALSLGQHRAGLVVRLHVVGECQHVPQAGECGVEIATLAIHAAEVGVEGGAARIGPDRLLDEVDGVVEAPVPMHDRTEKRHRLSVSRGDREACRQSVAATL